MSEQDWKSDLFNAAKLLVQSEIDLVRTIERSTGSNPEPKMKPEGRKDVKKSSKVCLSETLSTIKKNAKRKMTQEKKTDNPVVRDIYHKAMQSYSAVRKQTGLIYDESMEKHECLWDENYPECPARIRRIMQRCEELRLIDRCLTMTPRMATHDEILKNHTQRHIDILKATDGCTDVEKLEKLSSKYDAIYIHPSTYKLSLLATGSTIHLVESICKNEIQNGMAIIRPPGHHAMKSEYCGYCFFNNVAIAAELALRNGLANRILIVDWDVHHGQATQQMFYDDSRVVYFSIHRYENGEFWPNLEDSDFHYVGQGAGEGFNFNVPLNETGMKNADYIAIFQQVLLPMAYEYQPDLVIVSAGYDAAVGCPEGRMEITPACYAHLLSSLMCLANGKVAVILEGGYCLKSLAESAALTLRTLLGDPCPMLLPIGLPSPSVRETILNVIYAHRRYWKCYRYQDSYSVNNVSSNRNEIINRHKPVVNYKGRIQVPDRYETRNCYPVQSSEELRAIEKKIDNLILATSLNKAPDAVCLIYDTRMLDHRNAFDSTHPEKPSRISSIYKQYDDNGILQRCKLLEGRYATLEELQLVHSNEHTSLIKDTSMMKLNELEKRASKFNSVYLHPETWNSACLSAGSLLQIVDSVLNGLGQTGVAIVRPPGHHAEEDAACGFCIFNNVAIAAKYAIEYHHLKRVLILDWDVHHGNGTQNIFENDPRVLYISIHRYDNGNFFPNSVKANYSFVGTDNAKGYSVNIPWNKKGMSDIEYVAAFQQVVMPIAYQFNPELILVSAGFDACVGDPLGGCKVTPEMYGHMTHWLKSLANGRVILSLEGGYNIYSISHAMTSCVKALLGDPLVELEPGQYPCDSAVHSIKNVIRAHKDYWPALMFDASLPRENVLSKIALEKLQNEKIDITERLENLTIDSSKDKSQTTKMLAADRLSSPEKKEVICTQCSKSSSDKKDEEKPKDNNTSIQDFQIAGCSSDRNEDNGKIKDNLLDYLREQFHELGDSEMFVVTPKTNCPHVDEVKELPLGGIDIHAPCNECGSVEENWVCLTCYTTHCARSVKRHGLIHNKETEHSIAIGIADLSVWCYSCEGYIDDPRLFAARNDIHVKKFSEELPWTYGSIDER